MSNGNTGLRWLRSCQYGRRVDSGNGTRDNNVNRQYQIRPAPLAQLRGAGPLPPFRRWLPYESARLARGHLSAADTQPLSTKWSTKWTIWCRVSRPSLLRADFLASSNDCVGWDVLNEREGRRTGGLVECGYSAIVACRTASDMDRPPNERGRAWPAGIVTKILSRPGD
jgi:hypothetical protein